MAVGSCGSISINMETISVNFNLDSSNYAATLGFSVVYNSNIIVDINHVDSKRNIVFDLTLDDGDHDLQFIIKNKNENHTQVDDNNNIVTDSCLTITDMQINDIDLDINFYDNCSYHHDFNGTQDPIEDSFHGIMGCNGTVTFKFAMPFYIWLLENF